MLVLDLTEFHIVQLHVAIHMYRLGLWPAGVVIMASPTSKGVDVLDHHAMINLQAGPFKVGSPEIIFVN
eukprot:scaffold45999_cov37-Prasinocladus_malaysianus.AAC.6